MNQWPLWYLIFRQTHVENMKKNSIFCLERISETSNEYQRIAWNLGIFFFTTFEDGPSWTIPGLSYTSHLRIQLTKKIQRCFSVSVSCRMSMCFPHFFCFIIQSYLHKYIQYIYIYRYIEYIHCCISWCISHLLLLGIFVGVYHPNYIYQFDMYIFIYYWFYTYTFVYVCYPQIRSHCFILPEIYCICIHIYIYSYLGIYTSNVYIMRNNDASKYHYHIPFIN